MCKIVIILCAFCIILDVGAYLDKDYEYIKICNQSSPISLRTMNEVLIYKRLIKSESSANFKCFLHCLFTQYQWMDEDGGFELRKMRSALEESGSIRAPVLEYVMYTCTALKSVDKCERAFKFTECFWTKTAKESLEQDKFLYALQESAK